MLYCSHGLHSVVTLMMSDRLAQVRKALGPTPGPAVRQALPLQAVEGMVSVRYEWLKNWSAVADLDYWDGAEWITFIVEDEYYETC